MSTAEAQRTQRKDAFLTGRERRPLKNQLACGSTPCPRREAAEPFSFAGPSPAKENLISPRPLRLKRSGR
jgi:hypothetical protein